MKRLLLFTFYTFAVFSIVLSCKKEYSFERAAGTLSDSLGACLPAKIVGPYQSGVDLNGDNSFAVVEVNVTKSGFYSISTNLVNGFQFATNGTFEEPGLHRVKLRATGSPLRDTLTTFNCFFDSSICSFSVKVYTDSVVVPVVTADSMELNTWRFFDSTDGTLHRGIIDQTSTSFTIGPDKNFLNIFGWPGNHQLSNQDTLFSISLYVPNPQIETGTYPITSGVQGDNVFVYANNTILPIAGNMSYFFFYSSSPYKSPGFIFRLNSFDAAQKKLKGEFWGESRRRREYSDYVGATHQIHGEFYLQLH